MKPSRPLIIAAITVALSSFIAMPVTAADSPVPAKNETVVKNELPNVAILATGGTIASKGAGALSLTDYGVGAGK